MSQQNLIFFLIASTIAIIIISGGLIVFIRYFFMAKKQAELTEQQNKMDYEQALARTKTEVQANTLGYISRELHDNVGQLLWVAKMTTDQLKDKSDATELNELDTLLMQTADEVRHISHSLHEQSSTDFDLIAAIGKEIARIEKIGLISFKTSIQQEHNLSADAELVVFRIIQEFIANSLKHAQATAIRLSISATQQGVRITLADNGIGYDTHASHQQGNGIKNMKERAALLNASLHLQSNPQKGTSLSLLVPTNQNTNT